MKNKRKVNHRIKVTHLHHPNYGVGEITGWSTPDYAIVEWSGVKASSLGHHTNLAVTDEYR